MSAVAEEKKKNNSELGKKILRKAFFPGLFMFMEFVFHVYYYGEISSSLLFACLFGASFGGLVTVLTMVFPEKVNKLIAYIMLIVTSVFFNLQLVYGHIFKTFISVYSVKQNAGDAAEFWKEALHGILESLPGVLLLLVLPLALMIILLKKDILVLKQEKALPAVVTFTATAVVFFGSFFGIRILGTGAHTPADILQNNWILDLGIEKLGVITSTCMDFKYVLFGGETTELESYSSLSALSMPETSNDVSTAVDDSNGKAESGETEDISGKTSPDTTERTPHDTAPEVTPEPTPEPIDTSPNILNIDFDALAANESSSAIRSLHEYMAASEPTKKNEYTGMFEGYNLILLTCEGFSPLAVDRELTPTLYKLTHEGFVFNNFYTPIWYTSTSDGEYVECLSLLPYNSNSFKRSKNNALPFCMGNELKRLGYPTYGYHAHTATYYGRNETHPNMGYEFKAKYAGLPMTDTWPESDLEMIENSLPDYIDKECFNVYYMTVSGHLEYSFDGNSMSLKHRDLVKDLPYSNAVKAYIACNKELDLALEQLLASLSEAGILDKTVIAFGADHYPYGLTNEQISERLGHPVEENFELYRNNFVLWSGSIKEPIEINKYCSSLDILPTLLNLFGVEYDSRLIMGTDILSDSPALVIFSNQSFITDYCMYNSKNKEITMLTDGELPEGYIDAVSSIVRSKFEVSKSILLNDYYRTLPLEEVYANEDAK